MDESTKIDADLAQLAGLALAGQTEDVRLFVARLVRRYRSTRAELAEALNRHLKQQAPRSAISRKSNERAVDPSTGSKDGSSAMPADQDSQQALLRRWDPGSVISEPLLGAGTQGVLRQLLLERRQGAKLQSAGLQPPRTAVFVGKPGLGKTLSARWIASQLQLPLYVLDLAAVMSSLLGKSGSNLRAALDFAKATQCVLLLDEIDAVAKRRGDDSDVGELKRLVTVMLQEVDNWPASGLLLAATNHAELIDPALWRRFDYVINFDDPGPTEVKQALSRFLGTDQTKFAPYQGALAIGMTGASFSEIEREIQRFRRAIALGLATPAQLTSSFLSDRATSLGKPERRELAERLSRHSDLSQHAIRNITGVSRDTIRKFGSTESTKT